MSKTIFLFFLIITLLASSSSWAHGELCLTATKYYEKKYNIERSLLSAIAVVETGKWNEAKKANTPWPWTINVEGQSMFFAHKEEAVAAVQKFQQQGIESIDVGCMQINLKYHPQAFSSLEEAFEPSKNVAYAAQFLKNLYEQHGSWFLASKHYHSALPEKNIYYGQKLLTAFENLKSSHQALKTSSSLDSTKTIAQQYREKMLAKYREQREKRLSSLASKEENPV